MKRCSMKCDIFHQTASFLELLSLILFGLNMIKFNHLGNQFFTRRPEHHFYQLLNSSMMVGLLGGLYNNNNASCLLFSFYLQSTKWAILLLLMQGLRGTVSAHDG